MKTGENPRSPHLANSSFDKSSIPRVRILSMAHPTGSFGLAIDNFSLL